MATTIYKTALLAHSAQTMYALVADIVRYPEFLPGCSDAEILETTERGVVAGTAGSPVCNRTEGC